MTSAAAWDEARRIYGQTPVEGAASFKFLGRSMQSQLDAVALASRLEQDDAKALPTPQKLAMMTNSTRDAIRMLLGIRGRKWKWDPEDLPAAQRQAAAAEPAAAGSDKLAALAQRQISIAGVSSSVQAQDLVAFVNDCLFKGGADSISVSDGAASIDCSSEAAAAWVAARLQALAAAGCDGLVAAAVQVTQTGATVAASGLPASLESQRLAALLAASNVVTAQGPRLAATVSMANAEAIELALGLEDAAVGGACVTVERVAGTANQVRVLGLPTTASEAEVEELLGGEEAVKSVSLAPGPRAVRFHSAAVAEATAMLGKASVAGQTVSCSLLPAAEAAAEAEADADAEAEEDAEEAPAAAGSIDLGGADRSDLPGVVLSGVPLKVSAVALAAVFDTGVVTGLRLPAPGAQDAVVAVADMELREALASAMSAVQLGGQAVAAAAVAYTEDEEEAAEAPAAGRRQRRGGASGGRVDRERREKEELNAAWGALQQSEKERVGRIVKEVEAMCADISKAFNTNRAMYQGQWDNFDETVEPRRVPRPARFNIPHPQRHIASLHKWEALKSKGAGPFVNMIEHESFNNRWADADSGGAFMDRTVALFDEFCDEDAFYNGQFSDDNFIIPEDFEVKRYLPDSVKRQIFFLWSYKNVDLVTLARKFKTTTDRISAIVALQKTEPEQIAKGTYDDSIEKMLSRLVASDWAHLSDPDWDSPLDAGLDVAILPDTTLPEDGVPLRRWKGHRLRIRAHVEPTNGRVVGDTPEGKQERFRHRARARYSFKDISQGDRGTRLNSAPYLMVDNDGVRRPATHRERLLRHGVSKWFLPRRQGGGDNFLPWSKAEFDRKADIPAEITEDVARFRARRDAMYADHLAAKAAAQAEDA